MRFFKMKPKLGVKMEPNYFVHGDCQLHVSEVPKDAMETKERVLEYGEVTGHAHRLTSGEATILKALSGRRFLRVITPSDLSHEEHQTRVIPPGTYEIKRTREADHMGGVSRMIAD